jgi:hypothetical protein
LALLGEPLLDAPHKVRRNSGPKAVSREKWTEQRHCRFLGSSTLPYLGVAVRETDKNFRDGAQVKTRLKDVHRQIMLSNHPDRGGSPYLASKINEAKDLIEKMEKRG